MSLSIERFSLYDFRGYRDLTLDISSDLVIFVGRNAVGKTNIVEALQLLTSGESFRRPSPQEMVSWGREEMSIRLHLGEGKRNIEHMLAFRDGKKSFTINGKRKAKADMSRDCSSVLFIPDDLQMVKSSPAKRRDALDSLGERLSKSYSTMRSEYQQIVKQRNLLLKAEVGAGPLFDSWNASLAIVGARLCTNRYRLFARLRKHLLRIHESLGFGDKLDVVYVPSWERVNENGHQMSDEDEMDSFAQEEIELESAQEHLENMIAQLVLPEAARHTTLVGPHKDEVVFFINGHNARLFASQGQQRTIVLAWKLAEMELIREMSQQEPVLLLDDVMSELDEHHRMALVEHLSSTAQAFITTTNLGYFPQELLERAQVIEVPIEGTRYDYQG